MSILGKVWNIKNSEHGVPLLERLLKNRGLEHPEQVQNFLYPEQVRDFHDPFLMADMEKAVARIGEAIDKSERIMIFGDYDVDGITASAILLRTLKKMGAQVSCRLPHRIEDGYGLRKKFMDEFKKIEVKLVITVDNGISCFNEVAHGNSLGIDTIVTDHHTIPEKLPDAIALLHPKLPGAGYPCTELTGAGVALKLAQALYERRLPEKKDDIYELLDLACMGTVADLGELRGENRFIVKEGLQKLQNTRWPGLSRLKESAGIQGKLTVHHIGFMLCPRINAAGRMAHPTDALKLLISDGNATGVMADQLEILNKKRQKLTGELIEIAEEIAMEQKEEPLTVIAHTSFHSGIIGLIAARICEKYGKPAIIMEDRGEVVVGSCRSIPGINVVEILTHASELMTGFGGHAAAAGFEMPKKNLEKFTKKSIKKMNTMLKAGPLKPQLDIDCLLEEADITDRTIKLLELMEPYGMGNERPKFLCTGLPVHEVNTVGKEKKHLKITSHLNGKKIDCMAFKMGHLLAELSAATTIDAVCELEENEWMGRKRLQLNIIDFSVCA
ncbi:single-stranded-DNA-specific exonuclease RecJ [Candidatus Gracilibacteria bacterium]|nr:single-stranded-DNA-specific exonuclease RecJ [Candidatus Gracilibacteria bacterium]